ncbi:MAG: hypothetical protein RLZZ175_1453 [Bacteroidota bacterium]|jgi:putative membrane protein
MIDYNPKDWFSLIFKFHQSDTFRKLIGIMISVGVYAAIIVYTESHYFEMKSTTAIHSLLGFVISLLLVFRTNTAYDRWWEGRRLLGSLVNNSRNLAIKLSVFLKNNTALKEQARILIGNYALCLVEHLSERSNYNVIEDNSEYTKDFVKKSNHKPNAIAYQLVTYIKNLYDKKIISNEEYLSINIEVSGYTDIIGACERIKKSPIPFSYSLFIKKFIFVYIMTIPIFFSHDFGYAIVPLTIFIFYVLVSIELIAEEIENPFNFDSNDLPMDEIAHTICTNIKESLHLSETN